MSVSSQFWVKAIDFYENETVWLGPLHFGVKNMCLPLTVSVPAQAAPGAWCVELQPTGQGHPLLLLQEHLSLHHRGIVMAW